MFFFVYVFFSHCDLKLHKPEAACQNRWSSWISKDVSGAQEYWKTAKLKKKINEMKRKDAMQLHFLQNCPKNLYRTIFSWFHSIILQKSALKVSFQVGAVAAVTWQSCRPDLLDQHLESGAAGAKQTKKLTLINTKSFIGSNMWHHSIVLPSVLLPFSFCKRDSLFCNASRGYS